MVRWGSRLPGAADSSVPISIMTGIDIKISDTALETLGGGFLFYAAGIEPDVHVEPDYGTDALLDRALSVVREIMAERGVESGK